MTVDKIQNSSSIITQDLCLKIWFSLTPNLAHCNTTFGKKNLEQQMLIMSFKDLIRNL